MSGEKEAKKKRSSHQLNLGRLVDASLGAMQSLPVDVDPSIANGVEKHSVLASVHHHHHEGLFW